MKRAIAETIVDILLCPCRANDICASFSKSQWKKPAGKSQCLGCSEKQQAKIVAKHLKTIMKACLNCEADNGECFDPKLNSALKRAIKDAKRDAVPENYVKRVIQFAKQGYTDLDFKTYDTDWDSEAYLTVSGQNSNNSVSIKDDFLRAVESDGDWNLTARKDGRVMKTL